jgi:Undecaprenyl-phosphate glucose phosphotransferase
MLKQHSQLMLLALVAADALAIAAAWLLSYYLRFELLPAPKGVPELTDRFLPLLPLIVAAHLVLFHRFRLYRPRRSEGLFSETRDVVKAFIAAVLAVILIDYALPESSKISRKFVAVYAVVGCTCFALFRFSVRLALREARRRGYNQRRAVIVGAGRSGQRLLHALRRNRWTGLDVAYFVDDPRGPEAVHGVPVRGPLSALADLVERDPVDAVFIALPADEASRLEDVIDQLQWSMADVRFVPDLNPTHAMKPSVSELDGVPILALRQTPLYGWNAIVKRGFDVIVGSACLLVAALPMLIISALIRLGDGGPALYRQRRMGLDGQVFDLVKFRTMTVGAEKDGPVWSQKVDPRRTTIGAFLRRTSLDELPNLFNVLAGNMSLVGPRPERPEFIAEFKREIPNYMLRHKMKAGMTGFAQVRGLRGDSSLRKRIQHDVHYIRNWSLALDIRILLQTLGGVWFSRHEA